MKRSCLHREPIETDQRCETRTTGKWEKEAGGIIYANLVSEGEFQRVQTQFRPIPRN